MRLKYNLWAAVLVEIRSLSSKNGNIKHLLCVVDVFTKYAWVKPMKDKKDKKVLKAFIKIMNDSITNQINYWLMKDNSNIKKWFGNNDILMYYTHNEGKSVISKRFIKTLKGKIYKRMTANDI